ncbi:hypothetical protein [Aquabacterium sp.]|uniref:hypothetical protein n=1 Tax=Aquabacterium sp. TaxID=1872578 RepID=UPI0025B84B48|nr:hypothetical protein [Aquabacterium sp.]
MRIPCAQLQPGQRVMTSGGPRLLTWVGRYKTCGAPFWGWRWTPAPRPDGLVDCGYSGVHVDVAAEQLVALATPEPVEARQDA